MIAVTYNATDYLLLNDHPNWSKGYSVDFNATWDEKLSLTKRATRRPYTASPRLIVTMTVSSSGAWLRALRATLRLTQAQPVLCPFWPAVSFVSGFDAMPIIGGLMAVWKQGWGTYTIFSGELPEGYSAKDFVCPLLDGYIEPESDFKFLNVDFAEVKLKFTESSPISSALTITPAIVSNGPKPTGYASAPTVIPFRPQHTDVTEGIAVDVKRGSFGFTRDDSATLYPQSNWSTQTSRYYLKTASEVINMLAWYYQYASQGASFWCVGAFAIAYLSADYTSGDGSISVTDANPQFYDGDFICTFVDGHPHFARINIANAGTLTVKFDVDLPQGQPLYLAPLASMANGKLTIDFLSTNLGVAAKLIWNEVKPEEVIPGDETLGNTLGQLPLRAVMFHFSRDYGNGTIDNWYFTSFEDEVIYEGNTYVPGNFQLGDTTSTLNLENDSCDFSCALTLRDGTLYTANPLVQDVILGAEVPLDVTIFFVDLVPVGTIIGVGGDAIEGVGGEALQGVGG